MLKPVTLVLLMSVAGGWHGRDCGTRGSRARCCQLHALRGEVHHYWLCGK
jgi:hypothetical protein